MKYIAIAIMSAAALALAAPVLASGSMGGGAPGGQLGQKVYTQKIACSGCPFAGGIKTRDQVNMALAKTDPRSTCHCYPTSKNQGIEHC